jgi:hypothetical protein
MGTECIRDDPEGTIFTDATCEKLSVDTSTEFEYLTSNNTLSNWTASNTAFPQTVFVDALQGMILDTSFSVRGNEAVPARNSHQYHVWIESKLKFEEWVKFDDTSFSFWHPKIAKFANPSKTPSHPPADPRLYA